MTLGIGAICDRGECIVLSTDQRATYGQSPVGPNDECGKQYHLWPHRCFGLVAGSMSSCVSTLSYLANLIEKYPGKETLSREGFMQFIDAARVHELRKIYDWELKKRLGFSLRQLIAGKIRGTQINKVLAETLLAFLEKVPYKVEIIVAGYVGDVGMFFRATRKEKLEEETSPGVYAIGSGQIDAMRQLNMRGQHTHMSLPRTLLHVYEAMYVSQSKFVGPPPEMITVVRRRDHHVLKYPLSSLEGWRKLYENRKNTAALDDSDVAGKEVYMRLKIMDESEL